LQKAVEQASARALLLQAIMHASATAMQIKYPTVPDDQQSVTGVLPGMG